jgi:hypothetical protein
MNTWIFFLSTVLSDQAITKGTEGASVRMNPVGNVA